MDDLFKKIKNIMSGSKLDVDVTNKNELQEKKDLPQKKIDEDLVNSFMEQILDATWIEDELKDTFTPSYYLSKNKSSYWLMNINLKILMHIKAGVELIPIEKGEKNSICLIGTSTYSIPNELLICAGWN